MVDCRDARAISAHSARDRRPDVAVPGRCADGGELTLTVIELGGVLGEVSVADGGPRSADAEALDAAVYRKAPRREYPRRLDGEQEARLVTLACSAPPEGRKRWTLRLLAGRLVALEVVESVSYETVRQALKQTASSRG